MSDGQQVAANSEPPATTDRVPAPPPPEGRRCFEPKTRKKHQPRRGDDVVKWLKDRRNGYRLAGLHEAAMALDSALDDYRLHADVGLGLLEDIDDEGRW